MDDLKKEVPKTQENRVFVLKFGDEWVVTQKGVI